MGYFDFYGFCFICVVFYYEFGICFWVVGEFYFQFFCMKKQVVENWQYFLIVGIFKKLCGKGVKIVVCFQLWYNDFLYDGNIEIEFVKKIVFCMVGYFEVFF